MGARAPSLSLGRRAPLYPSSVRAERENRNTQILDKVFNGKCKPLSTVMYKAICNTYTLTKASQCFKKIHPEMYICIYLHSILSLIFSFKTSHKFYQNETILNKLHRLKMFNCTVNSFNKISKCLSLVSTYILCILHILQVFGSNFLIMT